MPFEALQVMMKNLLIQRFQLVTHMQDQPEQGSTRFLKLAKKVKLKESDGAAISNCKIANTVNRHVYTCENTTMAQFCERLPGVAGLYIQAPLFDMTGLKGGYDFRLSWTPKNSLAGGSADSVPGSHADDLTVFDALQQQLGLKLAEQEHPVPILIVDSANQTPTDK